MSKAACPICKKPTTDAFRPFCSKRCADVDLGRWFSGSYSVPAVEDDADEDTDGDGAPLPGQPRRPPL